MSTARIPSWLRQRAAEDYTGERHIVTVGRDLDGNYLWEERPGAPANEDEGKLATVRVILVSARDSPGGAGSVAQIESDIGGCRNRGRARAASRGAPLRGKWRDCSFDSADFPYSRKWFQVPYELAIGRMFSQPVHNFRS